MMLNSFLQSIDFGFFVPNIVFEIFQKRGRQGFPSLFVDTSTSNARNSYISQSDRSYISKKFIYFELIFLINLARILPPICIHGNLPTKSSALPWMRSEENSQGFQSPNRAHNRSSQWTPKSSKQWRSPQRPLRISAKFLPEQSSDGIVCEPKAEVLSIFLQVFFVFLTTTFRDIILFEE